MSVVEYVNYSKTSYISFPCPESPRILYSLLLYDLKHARYRMLCSDNPFNFPANGYISHVALYDQHEDMLLEKRESERCHLAWMHRQDSGVYHFPLQLRCHVLERLNKHHAIASQA